MYAIHYIHKRKKPADLLWFGDSQGESLCLAISNQACKASLGSFLAWPKVARDTTTDNPYEIAIS